MAFFDTLRTLFSVNYEVLNLWGYSLSLTELLGTLFGLACVYLTARGKVSCWPVGIINIFFFFLLFYQVRLYSDMLLQIYFLVMSVYGWWRWTHPLNDGERDARSELKVSELPLKELWLWCIFALAAVLILGSLMLRIHLWLPRLFPAAAAYPFPDAFTTVGSIAATVLMARKKRVCWLFWIAVDGVAIVVYFLKGINLVAFEYIIFAVIAVHGFFTWSRLQRLYPAAELSE